MSLTYFGTGGLFTRLGSLFGLAKKIRLFQIALVPTANVTTTGIRTTYANFAAGSGNIPQGSALIQPIADEERMAAVPRVSLEDIRRCVHATIIETVNANSAIPIKTLPEALVELGVQMDTDAQRIEQTLFTIGAAAYGAQNVGTGAVVLSAECRELIGDRVNFTTKLTDFPCIRPETVRITCVQDSRAGAIRSGSELFRIQGQRAYDNLDRRWPGGSGHDYVQAATSADIDASEAPGQNILTHSDFDDWSSNSPVNWTQNVGTPGTDAKATTTSMRGANALEIVGDGATLTSLRQQLRTSAGTLAGLKPDTLYCISFWVRHGGVQPAAGVLAVRLYDGSSTLGSMTKSVTCSTITASYVQYTLQVMSPINVPSTVYCQVYLTTAVTNTRSVYVDELTISEMPRPAKGAWGLLVFPGGTDWHVGDSSTVALSFNVSGDLYLEMDRFCDLYNLGLAFPSTAVATPPEILDSLIVDP